MKMSAFGSAEDIWPLWLWAGSSQQRWVIAGEAARAFARRRAAPAARRARRALTRPAFGSSGSARLFLFAVSFLKSFLAGVRTVLACTSCPLLGKQRLKPDKEEILLVCSGRCCGTVRCGEEAASHGQLQTWSHDSTFHLPPQSSATWCPFIQAYFGSCPLHAAAMPNKPYWGWLSPPLPQGLFELRQAITLLYS